jgi:fumarylpyruvate hydrolase
MIWDVPHILAHLSGLVELRPGDLVFTGTPGGVGSLRRGDFIEASVEGVATVGTTIV